MTTTLAPSATLRATALPLPGVTPAAPTMVGWNSYTRIMPAVRIDGRQFLVASTTGEVYTVCGKCSGRGQLPEFSGIHAGECYDCRWTGTLRYADSLDKAQRKVRSAQASEIRRLAREEAERPAREAAAREALAREVEDAHTAAIAEDARRTAEAAERAQYGYAGERGDKVEVTGVVRTAYLCEANRYGTRSLLVVVEDEAAKVVVKSFTSSGEVKLLRLQRGERVTVHGTVTGVDEDRDGTPQTTLTRIKVERVEGGE